MASRAIRSMVPGVVLVEPTAVTVVAVGMVVRVAKLLG